MMKNNDNSILVYGIFLAVSAGVSLFFLREGAILFAAVFIMLAIFSTYKLVQSTNKK